MLYLFFKEKQLNSSSYFQVLLNTLVYFNTKYFMLKTMDDHTKLSFTHIMKHWKKGNTLTPAGPKNSSNSPGSQGRSVLLRYYPPPSKGTPPFSFLLGCVNKAEIHQALLSQFSLLGEFFLMKMSLLDIFLISSGPNNS